MTVRVAMVGQKGVPATIGGIERHVEELGARLVDLGLDVTVFCRSTYSGDRPRDYRGMRLRYSPTVGTKHLDALGGSVAASLGTLRGYDVVHFHALGPGLMAPLPRYIGRTAVVQTIHGLDDERAKWGRSASRVLRTAQRMSATVPHETIVVSRALQEHYRSIHRRETHYIPNGVAPAAAAGAADPLGRLGLTPGDYVLFVGRLVPEKAVDTLVRAYRAVPGGTRLAVVGPSSHTDTYVDELQALAAADPRVILPGPVTGRDLDALYQHAAAFVLPSFLEGLPLTLLEAASHGLPVVVSDIGAHREICENDGPGVAMVPPGDVDALADALTRVLAAGEAARCDARRIRDRVLAHYSWEAAAAETATVYAQAADGRVN